MSSRSILVLIDSSPVLLLPSLLATRERSGDGTLQISLSGPPQFDASMQRLVTVLARHDITASIQERAETLEATVEAWLAANRTAMPLLDVSSASGGTAARAVLALQRATREYELCWFAEANNEVHLSTSGGLPDARVIDVGSNRCVKSAITPFDFMAIFGLERAIEDPYCGLAHDRLVPLAAQVLRIALQQPEEYRQLRHLLGAARVRTDCEIPTETIPASVRSVLAGLAEIDGWVRSQGPHTILCGTGDKQAVFFLSGGWLEIIVAQAVRRALPDHTVQINCGTTWGRKRRAEAEMDVAFVYHNALYLLSCKNDHLTDRFFPHLDRFRALTAEFGESRTRPVLLSTTELEKRHVRRCDAYEIGEISGPMLLQLINRSLGEEADALLKGLLTVSRGAPQAGVA
jgi:hypothetical protein